MLTLRRTCFALAMLSMAALPASEARAQASPEASMLGQGGTSPVLQVSVVPAYQRILYGDDHIGQSGVLVDANVRLGRNASLGLRTSSVSVGGTGLAGVQTVADTYAQASYVATFGASSLVANLGVNLPSGKRELAEDEFRTSTLMSYSFFGFRTPVLGQGLNVAPSLTVAVPVSDRLVVGAGAAYHLRGEFTPAARFSAPYDPGDELLLTGGLDVQLGRVSALSADVTFTTYGDDAFGEDLRFTSGPSLSGTVQLLAMQGFSEWRAVAHAQRRGRSEYPFTVGEATAVRSSPDRGLLRVQYRVRPTQGRTVAMYAQGRYFSAFDIGGTRFDGDARFLVDLGASPTVEVAEGVQVVSRFGYTVGSFTGIEAALGLRVAR